MPDMLIELQAAREDGTFAKVITKYTKPVLLIIDEWLLIRLNDKEVRNLFEVISKRRKHSSTIFCSQFLEAGWYDQLGGEGTLADAIMDRIAYDSYKINIVSIDPAKDISMRERYGLNPAEAQ
jgi:DNA replication protein DnaC